MGNVYVEPNFKRMIKELERTKLDLSESDCDCETDSELEHIDHHVDNVVEDLERLQKVTRFLEENQCPKCEGNLTEVEAEPPFNPVVRFQLECEECGTSFVFYAATVGVEYREGAL